MINVDLELNEYISKLSEIKPKLDEIGAKLGVTQVTVLNSGCSNKVVNQVVRYLKNLDLDVILQSKGRPTLKLVS